MINLQDISVSIQNTDIFYQLNIQFESGISYLIEGKNGVGKTSLLNLIAGKIQSKSGTITYDFVDDSLDWEQKYDLRKKNIHYVPIHALHELISGPDLFYQQRYYSIEESPLPTVIDFFGESYQNLDKLNFPESFRIGHLLNVPLQRLSNGQLKKIIILKQLLDSLPQVLLLDYPFEGLDLISRIELSEFLDHLVTHYNIQLIIADHDHQQLPNSIIKKIILDHSSAIITSRNGGIVKEKVNFNNHIPNPSDTETVVEMKNVKIQYHAKIILEHLNWKINRGERWALTGRNGSGKTTLFSLIYADHPMAYSQQVYLFGKRRGTGESIWDIKRRISYLGPEQLHFLDHAVSQLTVQEYLISKNDVEKSLIIQVLNFFQVVNLMSKKMFQLSSGQLQIVLLIAMFICSKELLLLDEPFQFLDPIQKKRVNDYLTSCLNENTTLILITHYEGDVERWTNHRLTL